MKIKDIVTMDEQGAFRSDVQLSDYENETLNSDLLKNYIFTAHTPVTSAAQRDYASVDVLEILIKQAFRVERAGSEFNRIVLTANYGRGKSHLALVLANFFARPSDSPEFKIIMKRLSQALSNEKPRLRNFQDFKESSSSFLVVRLQGDYCDDLQSSFLQALEQSLKEHPATRDMELPFWYTYAERWLNNLTGDARQKAENFLSTQNMDIALLSAQLRGQGAYDLVRETFKQVTGAYPDFGREINLKDLVIWAVDKVCIPNQLGGLLILFDEFSLFLRKYVESRTAGKLQELLNGISNRPGKSAFVAFTQIDIDTVAETYTRGQHLEDVKKELERLPKDKRARLFSLMESVLASYLRQDEKAWQVWAQQQKVRGALTQARETLYDYFSRRYDSTLRWNPETARDTVVKSCFPLHPMTTAILASHAFESGASENPRTALQFVRQMWKTYWEYSAQLENGRPNFVFAIALVDFFSEQISKKWYEAYRNVLEISSIPLSDEHRAVLKALLLQQAVDALDRKKVRGSDQLSLLSQLSGLDFTDVKKLLSEMSEHRVIDYDPYNKMSSLPSFGVRSRETEEVIQNAVESTPIEQAAKIISNPIPKLEISQEFGHVNDWSPRQIVFTAEQFTEKSLREIFLPYRAGADEIEENPRGWVVWLIAQNEDEKVSLRQSAQAVLDKTLDGNKEKPLPIVIVLPKRTTPGLVEAAQRVSALENLNQTDREKISDSAYRKEKGHAELRFKQELKDFLGGDSDLYERIQRKLHEYALPNVYRASVQTLRDFSLKSVMSECYRQAYALRQGFYTKYPVSGRGQNKLRTAVLNVSRGLFSDEIRGSLATLKNKDIQYQLSTSYLSHKWGLLAADSYVIQPPTSRDLLESWDLLEDAFFPGCKEVNVREILIRLLNPPYGQDYNTLTLLFAAWIGYHRYEIHFSLAGKVASLSDIKSLFDESKKPHDFLNRICLTSPLTISWVEKDKLFAEAIAILEHIRQGMPSFSVEQASDALTHLETPLENPALPATRREEIKTLRSRLENALQKAREYDEQISRWLDEFASAGFIKLMQLRNGLTDISIHSLVIPTQPTPDDLQRRWEFKTAKELDVFCTQYTKIQDISDYRSHETKLKEAKRLLNDYPDWASRVEDALSQLNEQYQELRQQEIEKGVIAEIDKMEPSVSLAVLYKYQERLKKLQGLSAKTAQKRDNKAQQIEARIQQYETLAKVLPAAIRETTAISTLHQQRDSIIANLQQVEGTSLHDTLEASLTEIKQLAAFFSQLQAIDALPQNTPEDLNHIRAQLQDIERQFSSSFYSAQRRLLEAKAQEIDEIEQRKRQEGQEWLIHLGTQLAKGENLDALLRELETQQLFLDATGQARQKQIKQILLKKLSEDTLAQIETLFLKLDADTRQKCLQHLQTLMDASK